jgi:hypothetical protein
MEKSTMRTEIAGSACDQQKMNDGNIFRDFLKNLIEWYGCPPKPRSPSPNCSRPGDVTAQLLDRLVRPPGRVRMLGVFGPLLIAVTPGHTAIVVTAPIPPVRPRLFQDLAVGGDARKARFPFKFQGRHVRLWPTSRIGSSICAPAPD